jgi:hypothetical protein
MTATLIIVLFAVVSLAAVLFLATWRFVRFDLDSELLPVDMESMATLIDNNQTEYLRSALTPKQFRLYEREQSLVIADYVKRISHNSRVVIAKTNRVQAMDASAQSQRMDMLNLAMQTRTLCVSVLVRLYLNAYTPWVRSPLQQVASIHNASSSFIPTLVGGTDGLTFRSRT